MTRVRVQCGRFQLPDCGLSVRKDNASARAMKLVSIAEPQLILCKDNASARAMELAPIAEPQLILCKDNDMFLINGK